MAPGQTAFWLDFWPVTRLGMQIPASPQSEWKSERFTLEAQPRSLYMMSGEARQVWKHSIAPVETVRYSVTFRTMATEHEPDR
jgi:hypothetical protein